MTKPVQIQSIDSIVYSFQMLLELLAQKDMEIDEAFTEGVEFDAQNHEDKRFALAERDRVLIDKGYDKGWGEGYDDGYYSGREEGYEEGYDDGFLEAYDQGYESGVEHVEEVYSKGYADGLADAYKATEDIDFEVFDDGIKQGFDNACIAMSKYANKLIEDTSDEEVDD